MKGCRLAAVVVMAISVVALAHYSSAEDGRLSVAARQRAR
jgi:hypothetical protein